MNFTEEDFMNARRISRAIQEYILSTGQKEVRTTDVYAFLARKGLIEKDQHEGWHFRKFLNRLKGVGMLKLIPQCSHTLSERGQNEWRFHLASDQRATLENISQKGRKAVIFHEPKVTKEELLQILVTEKTNVDSLTKRDPSLFTPLESEIRKSYPRAYEYWTEAEFGIIKRVYPAIENIDKMARLLGRQPHIVREKLENLHLHYSI